MSSYWSNRDVSRMFREGLPTTRNKLGSSKAAHATERSSAPADGVPTDIFLRILSSVPDIGLDACPSTPVCERVEVHADLYPSLPENGDAIRPSPFTVEGVKHQL